MNYQKLILVGNATKSAQQRKSEKGDVTYTTFNVAVGGPKDRVVFFPVSAFDKLGEMAAQYVTKGRQVLVEGRIDVSTSGRYNVVAERVVLGPSVKETAKKDK